MHSRPDPNGPGVRVACLGTPQSTESDTTMTNTTSAPWTFTATTTRGKRVQHSATSRAKAQRMRKAIARLPFVADTTTPAKVA